MESSQPGAVGATSSFNRHRNSAPVWRAPKLLRRVVEAPHGKHQHPQPRVIADGGKGGALLGIQRRGLGDDHNQFERVMVRPLQDRAQAPPHVSGAERRGHD
jgi:hypothetical protein